MKQRKTILGQIVMTAVLYLLFALPAYANPGMPGFMGDAENASLRMQAVSLALVRHLSLTEEQKTQIKSELEPLQAELTELREMEDNWRNNVVKARLEQIIRDLKADKDPTPPDAKEQELFYEMHQKRFAQRDRVDEAFDNIVSMLTDDQKQKLWGFDPREYLGFHPTLKPGMLLQENPMEVIHAIRNASDKEFVLMKERLSFFKERPGRKGRSEAKSKRHEKRVEKLVELMTSLREMSDDQFEAQAEKLEKDLAALLPGKRGRRGHHGGFGMKRGMGKKGKMGKGRGPGNGPGNGPGCASGDCPMGVGPNGDGGPDDFAGRGPGMGKGGPFNFDDKLKILIVVSEEFYETL